MSNPVPTIQPFDRICGSSNGNPSERAVVIEALETAGRFFALIPSDGEASRKIESMYRELAEQNDCDVDATDYCADVGELLGDYMPAFCFPDWDDGEYRVTPAVESAREDLAYHNAVGDELPAGIPDKYLRGTIPPYFLVISDHGNATLYGATLSGWREIWSVV